MINLRITPKPRRLFPENNPGESEATTVHPTVNGMIFESNHNCDKEIIVNASIRIIIHTFHSSHVCHVSINGNYT
uniref:Uncharacterized protein n=1 Tax=Smittium culicis TaxID=133412 RepID=A0A1R1Y997_9FUNG|nr:hypothetical protein AYI69_g4955 [Smittium culicis]